MKILVVEDEIYSRMSLVKQINESDLFPDLEIIEASNGKQGLEMFDMHFPELVFTDISMPFMSGLDLMKLILEKNPKTKIIIISGYADFEFAQEALNNGASGYLLKPGTDAAIKDVLSKFMQQNAQTLKHEEEISQLTQSDIMTKYIYSHLTQNSTLKDFVGDSIFSKLFDNFLVITFYFKTIPDKTDFFYDIKEICTNQVQNEIRLITITQNIWGLILKDSEFTFKILYKVEHYCNINNLECYVGISSVQTDPYMLQYAYEQSITAVKFKLFYKKRLLFYDAVSNKRTEKYVIKEQTLTLIRLYLNNGDIQNSCQVIENVFSDMNINPKISLNSYESVLMKLRVVFYEVNLDSKGSLDNHFNIVDYDSIDEIFSAIKKAVEYICKSKMKNCSPDDVVESIKNYIDYNYNRDISLKDLAERVFFLNHSYLSYLFKEKTGQNYTSYLKEVRINKAKDALGNKQLSITDVGSLCGYNDTSQFIQVFKKETGATPKKFRELINNPEKRANIYE